MSTADDIRAWLDRHEEDAPYIAGFSSVCRDVDGGLLRYGRALRAVLDVHRPADDGLCGACLLDTRDPACETVRRISDELGVPRD